MYHNTPLKVTHTLMLLCSFLSLVSLWTFVLVAWWCIPAALPDPATCIEFFSDLAGTAPLLNDSCTPNGAFGYIIRRTSTFSSPSGGQAGTEQCLSLPPRDGNAFFPPRIISRSHVCTVTCLPFNSNCYFHQVMRKYGLELLHVLSCLRHTPLSYTVTLCFSFPEYDRKLNDDLLIYSWSFDHDFGAKIFLLESLVVLRCLSSPEYCFKLFTMNIKDSNLGKASQLRKVSSWR